MEQIETFLTEPRFVTGGPLSLLDILPFAVLLALLILSIAGFFRHQTRLGQTPPPKSAFEKLKSLGAAMVINPLGQFTLFSLATAYLVLFLLALVATFALLATVIGWIDGPDGMEEARSSLGLGALLVALLGVPFLVWRSVVAQMTLSATQKQTALQDEALFNDKINAAATDLAARREVTRVLHEGKENETILTEWQDDLVTRAAAIDRLEGLAKEAMDRGDMPPAQRIARMLSIYVQELSREFPAQPTPEYQTREQIREWATSFRPILRPDMERAVQSLGRINPEDADRRKAFDSTNIDLRNCNLQGFDLGGQNYQGVQLAGAQLQGASLLGSFMQQADLEHSKMQGALLTNVQMQGANCRWAEMQAAFLISAQMQGADLFSASLQGAILMEARMQGASLVWTQLQGALLMETQMQGADLRQARMSQETGLPDATLLGASVRYVDEMTIETLRPFWQDIFADGTVLPEDPDRPTHWQEDKLTMSDFGNDPTSPFANAWRAWAAEAHPDVTIAPDWRADPGAD